jgi:hypothetical protein
MIKSMQSISRQKFKENLEISDEVKEIFELLPICQLLDKMSKEMEVVKLESVDAFLNQFEGGPKEDDGLPILIPQPVKHVQAQPNHGLPVIAPELNQQNTTMEVSQSPVAQVNPIDRVLADLEALKSYVVSHGRGMSV